MNEKTSRETFYFMVFSFKCSLQTNIRSKTKRLILQTTIVDNHCFKSSCSLLLDDAVQRRTKSR